MIANRLLSLYFFYCNYVDKWYLTIYCSQSRLIIYLQQIDTLCMKQVGNFFFFVPPSPMALPTACWIPRPMRSGLWLCVKSSMLRGAVQLGKIDRAPCLLLAPSSIQFRLWSQPWLSSCLMILLEQDSLPLSNPTDIAPLASNLFFLHKYTECPWYPQIPPKLPTNKS